MRTVNDHVKRTGRRVRATVTLGGAVQESAASTAWIKSNRCETNTCVEVSLGSERILVRNSADPAGAIVSFTRDEWVAFVGGVRDGDFDLGTNQR
jgi:hypothetical protein